MPKLNFYDTDAVKAFTLDVLVEGVETRRDLDFERRQLSLIHISEPTRH